MTIIETDGDAIFFQKLGAEDILELIGLDESRNPNEHAM